MSKFTAYIRAYWEGDKPPEEFLPVEIDTEAQGDWDAPLDLDATLKQGADEQRKTRGWGKGK